MTFRHNDQARRQVRFGAGVAFHEHQGEDISGGTFSGVTLSGDFYSLGWDGGKPADLSSSYDATATDGFYFDSSADAQQIMGPLWLGGTTTMIGSATIGGTNWTLAQGGVLTLGTSNDVLKASSADATYRLWIGNATAASAPFRVTKAGVITATSGTIGGWALSTGTFYYNGAGASGSSGMAYADYPFYAGQTYANRASAPFRVNTAGELTATSVDVAGNMTLTGSGVIRTASSGPRLELSASSAALNFWDSSGNGAGSLSGANSTYLELLSRTSGGIYSFLQLGASLMGWGFSSGISLTANQSAGTVALVSTGAITLLANSYGVTIASTGAVTLASSSTSYSHSVTGGKLIVSGSDGSGYGMSVTAGHLDMGGNGTEGGTHRITNLDPPSAPGVGTMANNAVTKQWVIDYFVQI